MLKADVVLYLLGKLKNEYPSASEEEHFIAIEGFIQYMEMVKQAEGSEVKMWSKSVDFVWHQFILNTKEYAEFCETYFGKFLHHTPSSNELGYWKDDLLLRQHYLTVMTSFGYNPFFMQQKTLSKSVADILPPIFAADQVLSPEGGVDMYRLSSLCAYDYASWNDRKTSWWGKRESPSTPYQEFLNNFNPNEYMHNLAWRNYLQGTSISANRHKKKQVESELSRAKENDSLQNFADNYTWTLFSSSSDSEAKSYRTSGSGKSGSKGDDTSSHTTHHSPTPSYSCGSSSHSTSHSSHSCGSSSGHSSHSCSSSSCSSSSCGGGF